MVITKYSLIGAVLQMYPSALEQACQVHSCDVDELIQKLDEHINGPA